MKLTIIPADNAVYKDNVMKAQELPALNLSQCNIPPEVHALQWYDTYGEIEYAFDTTNNIKPPNAYISVLPQWALDCVVVWDAWVPQPPTPEILPAT